MDNVFKCTLCGAKENLKKQKVLGQRLGSKAYTIHYECKSGHRLHGPYPADPSQHKRLLACNCPKQDTTRIRHLEAEIADMQKEIDRQKQKATAREGRIQRLKKELGFIE